MFAPDPQSIRQEIESFDGVVTVELNSDAFFFYDPDGIGDSAQSFPMATVVTSNAYDLHSDLDRDGVFRLNLGVDRETFLELFGAKASQLTPDYKALDTIMPHPEYGSSYFICVLNPQGSWSQVLELLGKAHETAAARYDRTRAKFGKS